MKQFAIWIAAALMACSPQGAATAPDPLAQTAGQPDITGEYMVTMIDGQAHAIEIPNHDPLVTIGAARIHFESQCIYADWTWQREGERVRTEPWYDPGSAMCARGLSRSEQTIQDIFGAATRITPGTDGGLTVEGAGHRLELSRLSTNELSLIGHWRVQAIDGVETDGSYDTTLIGDGAHLWWEPSCAQQYRNYTINGARFASSQADLSDQPVCEIGVPEELGRVWAALDAAETIRRTPEGGILTAGGGRSLLLVLR